MNSTNLSSELHTSQEQFAIAYLYKQSKMLILYNSVCVCPLLVMQFAECDNTYCINA